MKPKSEWVVADFNGILERGLLCLSHTDEVIDINGNTVLLREGMVLTAFDHDSDEKGKPDNIFATGIVERSPTYAQCNGSRWSLRLDNDGILHESDIKEV